MAASLEDVVKKASTSWRTNKSRSDARSREKLLHGLHDMLIHGRQEVLELLQKKCSMSPEASELEICLVVQDIAAHIESLKSIVAQKSIPTRSTTAQLKPSGVVLVATSASTTTTLKSILGPVSAAIAAGNVVILGNRSGRNHVVEFLHTNSKKYMNLELFFVCTRLDVTVATMGKIDKLIIIDDVPETYDVLHSLPQTTVVAAPRGRKLVIVGEGRKKWSLISSQIYASIIGGAGPFESLHGVFIRQEEEEAFFTAFSAISPLGNSLSKRSDKKSWNLFNAEPINDTMTSIRLKDLLDASKHGAPDLGGYLDTAHEKRSVLVIFYCSVDQIIDALKRSSRRLSYLALLAPASRKAAQYAHNFVQTDVFSVGEIPFYVPRDVDQVGGWQSSIASTMFPAALFSTSHLIFSTGSPTSPSDLTVARIRARYENVLSPLALDDRGERMGVFDQLFYTVLGIGSVLTVALGAGACYGWKFLNR